jgi:hypothetical protein
MHDLYYVKVQGENKINRWYVWVSGFIIDNFVFLIKVIATMIAVNLQF